MSFPVGVSTCSVAAGRSFSAFGSNSSITVVVTPIYGATHSLVWNATGDVMNDLPETFAGNVGSVVSVDVPHVDQTGFVDAQGDAVSMWYYRFKVTVVSEIGGGQIIYTKNIQPLVGATTLDLDLVSDDLTVTPVTVVGTPIFPFAPVVFHNADASALRPNTRVVIWAGSVQPTHMDPDYDLWVGP